MTEKRSNEATTVIQPKRSEAPSGKRANEATTVTQPGAPTGVVTPTQVAPTQPVGSWQQPPSPEPKAEPSRSKPRAARRAARRPAKESGASAASETKSEIADTKAVAAEGPAGDKVKDHDAVVAEARLTGTVQSGTVTENTLAVGGNVPGEGGEKGPLVEEARLTGSVQSGTTSPYYPPGSGNPPSGK
jgi:hypothetical protein